MVRGLGGAFPQAKRANMCPFDAAIVRALTCDCSVDLHAMPARHGRAAALHPKRGAQVRVPQAATLPQATVARSCMAVSSHDASGKGNIRGFGSVRYEPSLEGMLCNMLH